MSMDERLERRGEMWWPASDSGCWGWMHMAAGLPDQFMRHVGRFRTIIVAGANAGFYVGRYAERFESVIAVEPEPLNFHALVRNCQQANVVKLQAALGLERRCVSVRTDHDGNCGGFYVSGPGIVPTLRIDDFEAAVDAIHLDVEGYEAMALSGGISTIHRHRPAVIVENIGNESRYGVAGDEVWKFLEGYGYVVAEVLPHDTIYKWGEK